MASVAAGFRLRLLGLMLLSPVPAAALLIPGCRSVHTLFMRFPIDCVFCALPTGLAGAGRVVAIRAGLPPWRVAAIGRRGATEAVGVLELAAGRAKALGLEPGAPLAVALRPP